MAYSENLLHNKKPTESCNCNSTWIDVKELMTECTSVGGVICPMNEYVTDSGTYLSVGNMFLNCLPNECNNENDIKAFEKMATENPFCKNGDTTCSIRFVCPKV